MISQLGSLCVCCKRFRFEKKKQQGTEATTKEWNFRVDVCIDKTDATVASEGQKDRLFATYVFRPGLNGLWGHTVSVPDSSAMRRLSRLMESSIYVHVHNDSERSHFASAHRNCFPSAPCSLLRLGTEWAMTARPVPLQRRWDSAATGSLLYLMREQRNSMYYGIVFGGRSGDGICRPVRYDSIWLSMSGWIFQKRKNKGVMFRLSRCHGL